MGWALLEHKLRLLVPGSGHQPPENDLSWQTRRVHSVPEHLEGTGAAFGGGGWSEEVSQGPRKATNGRNSPQWETASCADGKGGHRHHLKIQHFTRVRGGRCPCSVIIVTDIIIIVFPAPLPTQTLSRSQFWEALLSHLDYFSPSRSSFFFF